MPPSGIKAQEYHAMSLLFMCGQPNSTSSVNYPSMARYVSSSGQSIDPNGHKTNIH